MSQYAPKYLGMLEPQVKKGKKKTPKNAFSFYLDESLMELRSKGENVKSKGEAVPYAHAKWKALSEEEKKVYENKAKEWKLRFQKDGRLDCRGNRLADRVDVQEVRQHQLQEQRKFLKKIWPPGKRVCSEHLYIISFQSLFELPSEGGYQPCEVACIKFSLLEGIIQRWHHFIDPGPIKLGLRGEIKIWKEKTHQIPEEDFDQIALPHYEIWCSLLSFINADRSCNVNPPLFTKMAEIKKTKFCVDWLAQMAGMANCLAKVYELEDAVADLFVQGGALKPSLTVIERGLESTLYDCDLHTRCEYHEEIECNFCSLLIVQRCCFWIGKTMAAVFDYEVTPNHFPEPRPSCYTITPPEDLVFPERQSTQRKQTTSGGTMNPIGDFQFMYNSGDSFSSRDIRYRSGHNSRNADVNDETSDNLTGIIKSDESTCAADGAASIFSSAVKESRRPKTTAAMLQQKRLATNLQIPPLMKSPSASKPLMESSVSKPMMNLTIRKPSTESKALKPPASTKSLDQSPSKTFRSQPGSYQSASPMRGEEKTDRVMPQGCESDTSGFSTDTSKETYIVLGRGRGKRIVKPN